MKQIALKTYLFVSSPKIGEVRRGRTYGNNYKTLSFPPPIAVEGKLQRESRPFFYGSLPTQVQAWIPAFTGMTRRTKIKMRNFPLPYFLSLCFIFLLSIPLVTFAQSPDPAPVNMVLTNFLTSLTIVIQILILSALIVFCWGVVKLIFAASDPKKIEQAKYIILWGIIGIFVLASMGGILAFIKTYLGVPNNSPIPAPMFTTFLG